MKAKKGGKEDKKENREPAPKKKTTMEADKKARVALGSGDISKVRVGASVMLRIGLGLKFGANENKKLLDERRMMIKVV